MKNKDARNSLGKIKFSESFWVNANFLVASIGIMFLFRDCLGLVKVVVFCYGVLALFSCWKEFLEKNEIGQFKEYFVPWIPWFVGLVLLCFAHGFSGFSKYYNAYIIMLCLLILPFRFRFQRSSVFLVCSGFCFVISLFALCQMVGSDPGVIVLGDKKNTLFGGLTLLTVLTVCALFDDSNKSKKYRMLLLTTIVMALICIAVSEMRTALVGMGAGLLVLLTKRYKTNKQLVLFLVTGFILFALAYLLSGRLMEGVNDLKQLAQGNSNSSWGIRVELWKLALQAFLERPYFGWGLPPIDNVLSSGFLLPDGIPNVGHFHNDLLESIVMGGAVGLCSFLATIIVLFRQAFKDLSMLALLATMVTIGLFERYWFDQQTLFLFCCLWVMFYKSKKVKLRIDGNKEEF